MTTGRINQVTMREMLVAARATQKGFTRSPRLHKAPGEEGEVWTHPTVVDATVTKSGAAVRPAQNQDTPPLSANTRTHPQTRYRKR